MAGKWYLAEKKQTSTDCIVERAIVAELDPGLLEIWGQEISAEGEFSDVKLLDYARVEDGGKIRPKWWLKKILIEETYYKEKDFFARKVVPVLAITMVFNEEINMWERLDLGEE